MLADAGRRLRTTALRKARIELVLAPVGGAAALHTKPGNMMVGTHINRNISMKSQPKPFMTYVARVSYMLQQGSAGSGSLRTGAGGRAFDDAVLGRKLKLALPAGGD